jgi:hypothetical protein
MGALSFAAEGSGRNVSKDFSIRIFYNYLSVDDKYVTSYNYAD